MTDSVVELRTQRATRELAGNVARAARPGDLFVLSGPLGAGKTFFVRAVLRSLGLPEYVAVPSPTFSLVLEYDTTPHVVHADLYRLETIADVERLGLVERRDQGSVLFVEWGEPYVATLGGDAAVIELALEPRRATLRATGARSRERIAALP